MTPSCKGPIQTFSTSFGTCICLRQWSIICYIENCVAWFLMWISLSVKYKLSSTDILQLKSHIGKPFSTREGVKQMKAVKECVTNPQCLVLCALKHLPGYKAGKNATRTDVVCFDWKTIYVIISCIMGWRHEERLIAAKKSNNNFTFSWRRSHFFSKLLSFTVVTSLVTNGFRFIAGCFGFIFRSWLC